MRFTFNIDKSTNRKQIDGKHPVVCRIRKGNKKAEFTIEGRYVAEEDWSKEVGFPKNNHKLTKHLINVREELAEISEKLKDEGKPLTPKIVKSIYKEEDFEKKTLIEAFKYHNRELQGDVATGDISDATLTKYETILKKVKRFLSAQNKEDISLSDLDYKFIKDFFDFLRKDNCQGLNKRTAKKYCKNLKKITNLAIRFDWLDKDPFAGFNPDTNPPKVVFLTQEELDRIENKDFGIQRLQKVADIFIFCSYTGFYFSNAQSLTMNDIGKANGSMWIFAERKKNGRKEDVPLLPPAQRIIDKYSDHPRRIKENKILPSIADVNAAEFKGQTQQLSNRLGIVI